MGRGCSFRAFLLNSNHTRCDLTGPRRLRMSSVRSNRKSATEQVGTQGFWGCCFSASVLALACSFTAVLTLQNVPAWCFLRLACSIWPLLEGADHTQASAVFRRTVQESLYQPHGLPWGDHSWACSLNSKGTGKSRAASEVNKRSVGSMAPITGPRNPRNLNLLLFSRMIRVPFCDVNCGICCSRRP